MGYICVLAVAVPEEHKTNRYVSFHQCVEMSFIKDFSQLSTDYNGVKIKKGTFMKGFFFSWEHIKLKSNSGRKCYRPAHETTSVDGSSFDYQFLVNFRWLPL